MFGKAQDAAVQLFTKLPVKLPRYDKEFSLKKYWQMNCFIVQVSVLSEKQSSAEQNLPVGSN